jgi:hypothetical protein
VSIGYPLTAAEQNAVPPATPTNFAYPELNVLRYGADPTGVADSTSAFAAAHAVALKYASGTSGPLGACIYAPKGKYSVITLDFSTATAQFGYAIKLRGDGRYMTSIAARAAGNILLNLVGTNQFFLEDLTLDSTAVVSQCGILLARSTVSQNCAYNKFRNVFLNGSFTIAGVINIAAESQLWENCAINNQSGTNHYCGLWSGGGGGSGAAFAISITGGSAYTTGVYTAVALTGGSGSGAQATITVAGGAVTQVLITAAGSGYAAGNTLSATAPSIGGTGSGFSFPLQTTGAVAAVTALGLTGSGYTLFDSTNTCNVMTGCEVYAPFNGATPWVFVQMADYTMLGCDTICGPGNNCHLATYQTIPGTGVFQGAVSWFGCHQEVNGSSNVIHYLQGFGTQSTFIGINVYGGYLEISSNTSILDYDRTTVAEQPILLSSTWTSPTVPNNTTGMTCYLWGMQACDFTFMPDLSNGVLIVSGLIQASRIEVQALVGPATRFIAGWHRTIVQFLPTTGSFTVGDELLLETPVVGQPLGWRCTTSGTLTTIATTGSITNGTNVLTGTTGLAEGQRINVAGAGGPFYVREIGGSNVYLDSNATATVVGTAVTNFPAVLVPIAQLFNKVTGWGTATGASVQNNFSGGTATLATLGPAVAQIINDLKSLGLYGA